jgi:protein-S-isoprenylcysteine O-methyltransferase Ste14
MSFQVESAIIVFTWLTLLVFYYAGRNYVKSRFLENSSSIHISDTPVQETKPGSMWSKIGVLLVFTANIATVALIFTAAISPTTSQRLEWASVSLPQGVYFTGSVLFVLDAVWGLLAVLFNPNYTPIFRPMKKQFLLATRGPYAVVRHPRYAAEIWLNVILFMFTGIWLPLLGVLGWIAIYYQARAEETMMMTLAQDEYGKYRQRTGMLIPRFTGKKNDFGDD